MTTTAPVTPRTQGLVAPLPFSVIKAFALRHADISHANALITTWFGGWFGKRVGGVGARLPGVGGRRG
jgi:hypothetical protein